MVKTQAKAAVTPSGRETIGRSHSTLPSSARLYPNLREAGAAPRLTVQPSVSRLTAEQARRTRTKVAAKKALLRGEEAAISTVVSFFVVACALGVFYLAAFAKVAAQGRTIHALQANVTTAEARQDILVAKLTQLTSGASVQRRAQQQGMVLSDRSIFVTLKSAVPTVQTATRISSIQ